jgi:CAF1 family ribonuclease
MRESWEELIVNQIGVWRVFMALSLACHGFEIPRDSITFAPHVKSIDWERGFESMGNLERTGRCVPIVGHNCYMDLMFLLSHFHSHRLPEEFSEAKELIHSYFPHIYDTKLLATEHSPPSDSTTHLDHLYTKMIRDNDEMGGLVELVHERNEHGHVVGSVGNAHDAAYDAFMTGCIYAALCLYIGTHEHFQRHLEFVPGPNSRVGSLTHLLPGAPDTWVRSLFLRNKVGQQLSDGYRLFTFQRSHLATTHFIFSIPAVFDAVNLHR